MKDWKRYDKEQIWNQGKARSRSLSLAVGCFHNRLLHFVFRSKIDESILPPILVGVFHAMENYFAILPRYGRFSSTLWKTLPLVVPSFQSLVLSHYSPSPAPLLILKNPVILSK